MSYNEYEKAQKLGLKAFKAAVAKGENEYLPVLDEILENIEIQSEVNLGLVQIPLENIVGTSNVGRTFAFANNFMPILDYKTEFGTKWSALYDSQIEEGIRDAIKVYEYLNKFYVVEGNKRVSVLKFVGASTIFANVTRKIPKYTEDKEIKIYYEYMDFYKLTDINYLSFSQEGGFKKILDLVTDDPTIPWTGEQKKDFGSANNNFQVAFRAKGGDKLALTNGEALLKFIEIYGYEEIKDLTPLEMETKIAAMWEEFTLQENEQDLELAMEPAVKKASFVDLFKSSGMKPTKIAFIYDKDPQESEWLYGHELGRTYLEERYESTIKTYKVYNLNSEEETIEAMEDIISMGAKILFTTSPQQISASLKVAAKHPEVVILNCSLNSSYKLIRTYYARFYEVKFLAGMIAGALAKNGKIGYLADYPIVGMTASINAFALGAQMINPDVEVYLEWTTVKGVSREAAIAMFKEKGIHYVSDQVWIKPSDKKRQFGLYNIEEDEPINLAMPVYQWGVFYEKLVENIQNGIFQHEDKKNTAINYWWGLSAGVVDLIYSRSVPESTLKLVHIIKTLIINKEFSPFEGLIRDQEGTVRNGAGKTMQPEDIMNMNWLAENVIGEIPTIDELKDEAKGIVELKGVSETETL